MGIDCDVLLSEFGLQITAAHAVLSTFAAGELSLAFGALQRDRAAFIRWILPKLLPLGTRSRFRQMLDRLLHELDSRLIVKFILGDTFISCDRRQVNRKELNVSACYHINMPAYLAILHPSKPSVYAVMRSIVIDLRASLALLPSTEQSSFELLLLVHIMVSTRALGGSDGSLPRH